MDSAFRDAIRALTGRDPLRKPLPELDRSLTERSPDEAIVPVTLSDLSRREASSEPDLSTAEDEAATVALAIAARAGKVTNMMLREASGLDHRGARRVLLTLVDRGLLEQRGERRGSHYVVVHHAAELVSRGRSGCRTGRGFATPRDRRSSPARVGQGGSGALDRARGSKPSSRAAAKTSPACGACLVDSWRPLFSCTPME